MTSRKRRQLPDWLAMCKVQKSDTENEVLDSAASVNNKAGNSVHKDENSIQISSTSAQGGPGTKMSKFDNTVSKCNSKEERQCLAAAEFQKRMDDFLPEMLFTGTLTYSSHKNDCNALCEEIESSVTGELNFLGFDMEWPVTYRQGQQDPTAVVQLCTGPERCYLFHLSTMQCIPPQLNRLLKNSNIKKVGVGIESDLWKLERDFDIQVQPIIKNSMVDLALFANSVLKTSENWSLDGLTRHLFKQKINKTPEIRKSDWSRYPLSEAQKKYAATDAYVSYEIYQRLLNLHKN
ncbi:Werner syndrome ATP-dependent helicase homolog [Mizuhopecten yessoensis]|uniref:Werner syndrome ATP-dependent helicase homolog n=1 Tax=Mizuhopecten yessoensis TaxID=6573 RepID=UPI000B45890F|nr:Werner syndrome ATP-dependent helicase homolog [Mizuhopecten yessoensis]XP_021355398.1 Werner syndrome ATP-dependent helicase homolog [Mizuhopecten yessoensis]